MVFRKRRMSVVDRQQTRESPAKAVTKAAPQNKSLTRETRLLLQQQVCVSGREQEDLRV